METLIKTIRIHIKDKGMEFGIENCVMFIIKSGKRLPNLERIRTLGEKENCYTAVMNDEWRNHNETLGLQKYTSLYFFERGSNLVYMWDRDRETKTYRGLEGLRNPLLLLMTIPCFVIFRALQLCLYCFLARGYCGPLPYRVPEGQSLIDRI